jgi:hypothetical protein
MAGMLLFFESILMPLYSLDDKHKLSYNNCSDYVSIRGETNINQFNFIYIRSDFSIVNSDNLGQFKIEIPVKDFVPSNPFMYKDFLDLLKADEYPFINISIPREQFDIIGPEYNAVVPVVNITIAGITRSYKLNCSIEKCSEGVLIIGSEALRLSDFQLNRVERLGGLVKLRDEINVSFGFIVNFTVSNQISSQR